MLRGFWQRLIIGCGMVCMTALPIQAGPPRSIRVYVGTYTKTADQGICLFEFDSKSGEPGEVRVVAPMTNPSFLAIHPTRPLLFAVSEVSQSVIDGANQATGMVHAFALDSETGGLKPLNQQPSGGAGPCHLSVDPSGQNVLVANYVGGSVSCIPISEDGTLGPPSATVRHTDIGNDGRPGKWPRGHSVNVDPQGKFAVVADLGLDRLYVYEFDAEHGLFAPHTPPFTATPPGSGPRHFAFHPRGRLAFHNNETSSTLTSHLWDKEKGTLQPVMTWTTLPETFRGHNATAECVVHPGGGFVYVSNRGDDCLAVFRIIDDGAIQPVGHVSTQGKTPRNFCFDPTGTFLLAANQGSDSIVFFRVDPQSGMPESTGHVVKVPQPVCLRMLPVDGETSPENVPGATPKPE